MFVRPPARARPYHTCCTQQKFHRSNPSSINQQSHQSAEQIMENRHLLLRTIIWAALVLLVIEPPYFACSWSTFGIATARKQKKSSTVSTFTRNPLSLRSNNNIILPTSSALSSSLLSTPVSSSQSNSRAPNSPSPLSLTLDELSEVVGGKGRAAAVWDCYRAGLDPLQHDSENDSDELSLSLLSSVGNSSLKRLQRHFGGGLQETVATELVDRTVVSSCGTTKLLLRLLSDGLEVETVIIPWPEKGKSTLCVSSQVGCRQGCTFCMTGRMGMARSLSADEILAQLWVAQRTVRREMRQNQNQHQLFPIDNVVFMGMGEPADNAEAVVRAVSSMTDPRAGFQLAPRRVTISTVAPTPNAFVELGQASCCLAWSVHASQDEIRQMLVPTTRHSMVELRQGLIQALLQRSRKLRSTMLEVALLDQINDSVEAATHLADFCRDISEQVPGSKVTVNLIPWNDINAPSGPAALFRKPSLNRVLAFQKVLVDRNIRCYIRTTRGDDQSAACGQLATAKNKKKEAGIGQKDAKDAIKFVI